MVSFLSFSERNGYEKVSDVIQIKSMSVELRSELFNAVVSYMLIAFCVTNDSANRKDTLKDSLWSSRYEDGYRDFFRKFYANFLRQKLTSIPDRNIDAWRYFERYFDEIEWHKVYSFLEWFGKNIVKNTPEWQNAFHKKINDILENNLSGYRLVDNLFITITDNTELDEITEGLKNKQLGVQQQLHAALQHMHDKNYRNSVKESISAVETFVRTKTETNDLGAALSKLQKQKIPIPECLKQGFDKIYGWTCGHDGIRHALMDDAQNVTLAEAKFMLVACSAFVNYLNMKL